MQSSRQTLARQQPRCQQQRRCHAGQRKAGVSDKSRLVFRPLAVARPDGPVREFRSDSTLPLRAPSRTGSSSSSSYQLPAPSSSMPQQAAAAPAGPLSKYMEWWDSIPSRYKIILAGNLSFVICNMDKVNMSVAIIPMAQDFGWSPSVAGLVQSAFFWGYIMSQLPGGYLTSKHGGRRVMPAGVTMWSLATAAVPLLAGTVPGLCVSRAAVGLGEAVAPSAATDMVSRVVPASERSTAVSMVFGGLHVGSILGLLAAPYLITNFGWETVFVVFGAAGLAWVLWFEQLMAGIMASDPETAALLTADRLGMSAAAAADAAAADSHSGSHGGHAAGPVSGDVPWRAFLRSRAVQALMYTHFCNNWFHYTMLAWLPTYFTDTMSVDLMHAAQTALLPPLAGIAASAVAGPTADALIARGVPVPTVRKIAQCTAFLLPTACLLAASQPTDDSSWTVALITAALGISSFSLAGLYCTHQDLSPKYSSAMLGLTNTSGAIPGILGVAFTGLLYDQTGSWPVALFYPTMFFLLTGAAVYTMLGSNAPEDYDVPELNAPFAFEARVRGVLAQPKAALAGVRQKLQSLLPQLPRRGGSKKQL
uniref:Major facilitator superfamily (MFS) profile domain-containing protein n=1 Tax=Tetradesmus obliquus TaxID=3088 RepID=A0A383V629_TETOB|eukprot:jgi/Sobl393_1/256/SZX60044.1